MYEYDIIVTRNNRETNDYRAFEYNIKSHDFRDAIKMSLDLCKAQFRIIDKDYSYIMYNALSKKEFFGE